jgi:hypothetical protein
MRQDERKSRVLLEWDRWVQTKPVDRRRPTARDTLMFFCELQDRRSPLLDFRSGGRDKWQIVHAWLVEEGRVSEAASPTRSAPRRGRAAPQMRAAQNNKQGGKRPT